MSLIETPDSTLERIVPDSIGEDQLTGRNSLVLHLERYRFAIGHIKEGRVLDIACGAGYGSRLISDSRPDVQLVVDVDNSPQTIAYAKKRYGTDRVQFHVANAEHFSSPIKFDYVVSLETIEHLKDPAQFIKTVTRILAPDGLFIISAPVTPSVDANPHHLHDFTRRSITGLLNDHQFIEIDAFEQVQRYDPVSILKRKEKRLTGLRTHLLSFYIQNPQLFYKRLRSLVIDGFNNRYAIIVCRISND